jgi:hypothetical protein
MSAKKNHPSAEVAYPVRQPGRQLALDRMLEAVTVHAEPDMGSIPVIDDVAGGAKVDAARLALPLPLLLPSGIRVFRPQRFAHALQRRQTALMRVCEWDNTGHVCMLLPT